MTDGNYHEVCEASACCHHFLSNLALPAAHQLWRSFKRGRLTMLPDLTAVTGTGVSLDLLNTFLPRAIWVLPWNVAYFAFLLFKCGLNPHVPLNPMIFKGSSRSFPAEATATCPCVFAKLLLMRKIGFIFLYKWRRHFLSEAKMMIQQD